ncbi:MAG TPA: lysophospholipase [Spirochaetota bacterium]|nr:lysophospholipase [Spirochaetota bacterium]
MKRYAHSMGVFLADDMVRIFYQSWQAQKPKGVVVISHGLGEHSDRYTNIMNALAGAGISFYALDHRGHGKSGGKRGHVDRYMKYVDDLKKLVDTLVKTENPGLPVILLGHSMGGLIAMRYALEYPEDLKGLILSAPALVPAVAVPGWKKSLGRIFSVIAPGLAMNNELDPADISSDPDVVQAYRDDPLVHDMVSARWYTEYLDTAEFCLARPAEIEMPLLVIHGTADRMVSPESSRIVFENASSRDKKIFTWEGLFHETMNERIEDRKKVLKTISAWITSHMSPGRKK